jgi:elongation factor Ts
MSTISAADVKKLRDMTSAPMMDCKAALTETGGDLQKAIQKLREKNASIQAGKGMRETAEGRIAVYIDPAKSVAGIVEVRCESAPVAKSDDFIKLANEVAKHVALTAPPAANVDELLKQPFADNPKRTINDRLGDVVGLIRENMRPARFTRLTGGQFGSYVHFDGTVGVLLQVQASGEASGRQTAGADSQLLKDICMHITAKAPAAARREDVDPALVEREKEIAKAQAAATGKPANIVEKIAEGKIRTWYAENVLVEQPFVKDDSKTVGELLAAAGLTIQRFVRYKVGEVTG